MAQTREVRGRSTTVFTDKDGLTKVVYHQTPVVQFDAKRVILNSGGYRTLTTKLRMNQAANQYGLGFRVVQYDHDWFVRRHGDDGDMPFVDEMEFSRVSLPFWASW